MIVSMTGYGKAEGVFEKKKYSIEIRSVNNRFCEISFKYPKLLASKDFELKEIVRNKISRGKITVSVNVDDESESLSDLNVDEKLIREYFELLKKVNKVIGSEETVKIEHILNFSNLFLKDSLNEVKENEFKFISGLLNSALDDLIKMKTKEGNILMKDISDRIKFIDKETVSISKTSKSRLKTEKDRLKKRLNSVLTDKKIMNENRLEQELVLFAERIDITEELIRLRSHNKYFNDYAKSGELAGRRLNFLIQEINREINTIAAKSLDAGISQKTTVMKEELEKIREQLQNVE